MSRSTGFEKISAASIPGVGDAAETTITGTCAMAGSPDLLRAELHAVHDGHHDVEDDEVDRAASQQVDRLQPVRGRRTSWLPSPMASTSESSSSRSSSTTSTRHPSFPHARGPGMPRRVQVTRARSLPHGTHGRLFGR
jgi:hypothetical protein